MRCGLGNETTYWAYLCTYYLLLAALILVGVCLR